MQKNFCFVFLSLLFFSCASSKVEKTSFNGMIYDANNEPVVGVNIIIDEKHQTISDMYGRFYIDNLLISQDYSLTASKKDYETICFPFEFQNITQIAYITMYSSSQLLSEAEKALQENNIQNAKSFISRAEKCAGKTISSQYLTAILLYKSNNITEALNILNEISIHGDNNPYIYLFMADIYEYNLQDYASAVSFLNKFLKNSYDSEIEKRYTLLCSQL